MKGFIIFAAVFVLAVAAENTLVTHYYGYQVIRTFPETTEQYEALHQLEKQGHLDFWTDMRRGSPTDIMVGPHQMKAFRAHLQRNNIKFETLIADVEKNVEAERQQKLASKASGMDWLSYHELEVIQEWLVELAAANSDFVSVQSIGKSYEGRDLPMVKVSTGGSGKSAVWIDGNIHAREWISPATTTYILNELVTNWANHVDLLEKFDFYILPNLNPDGYAWTHSNARLWRKTRQDHDSILGCLGVDANRNWGYLWGEAGASSDKCSDTYHGPSEFSEPENLAVKQFIESTPANWLVFISFHSYGQYALLPYGDGSRPDDFADLMEKGNIFAEAVKDTSGQLYVVGNSEDVLYTTSGTSQDWAKGSGIFKYSYIFELQDTGAYGFQLPADQIIPTGLETWNGLLAMLRAI